MKVSCKFNWISIASCNILICKAKINQINRIILSKFEKVSSFWNKFTSIYVKLSNELQKALEIYQKLHIFFSSIHCKKIIINRKISTIPK